MIMMVIVIIIIIIIIKIMVIYKIIIYYFHLGCWTRFDHLRATWYPWCLKITHDKIKEKLLLNLLMLP